MFESDVKHVCSMKMMWIKEMANIKNGTEDKKWIKQKEKPRKKQK